MTDKEMIEAMNLPFKTIDTVLIKPLAVEKVTKTFMQPNEKGKVDKKTNASLAEFKEVTKEVDSIFRKGIVLALPINSKELPYQVGDCVVYRASLGVDFDMFKDSQLIRMYDILAVDTGKILYDEVAQTDVPEGTEIKDCIEVTEDAPINNFHMYPSDTINTK